MSFHIGKGMVGVIRRVHQNPLILVTIYPMKELWLVVSWFVADSEFKDPLIMSWHHLRLVVVGSQSISRSFVSTTYLHLSLGPRNMASEL